MVFYRVLFIAVVDELLACLWKEHWWSSAFLQSLHSVSSCMQLLTGVRQNHWSRWYAQRPCTFQWSPEMYVVNAQTTTSAFHKVV